MDRIFCLDDNSFPANSKADAIELFSESVQGVLELLDAGHRAMFFLDTPDSEDLHSFELAPNFTFQEFIEFMTISDPDVATFLYEVEDKSPAIDNLTNEQMDELSQYDFYISDMPMPENPSVYSLAWTLSAFLLSITTNEIWENERLRVSRSDGEGKHVNETTFLKNISSSEHGKRHRIDEDSFDIDQSLSPHIVTKKFTDWFDAQSKENQQRIKSKLEIAHARGFQGARPLFETLKDSNGMREIRLSAHAGGAIRILFKHYQNNEQVILSGFIKYSNSDGYASEIPKAEKEFADLTVNQ